MKAKLSSRFVVFSPSRRERVIGCEIQKYIVTSESALSVTK